MGFLCSIRDLDQTQENVFSELKGHLRGKRMWHPFSGTLKNMTSFYQLRRASKKNCPQAGGRTKRAPGLEPLTGPESTDSPAPTHGALSGVKALAVPGVGAGAGAGAAALSPK